MSINTMTDTMITKRAGCGKARHHRSRRRGRARNAWPARRPCPASLPPGSAASFSNALNALIQYIPTESVTLYIATLAAAPALEQALDFVTVEVIYWFFAVLTPILFVLIYLGKRRSANLPVFPKRLEWPIWGVVSATIAFMAWALAVPSGPYLQNDAGGVVAGLLAVFVSLLLELIGRVVTPNPKKPAPAGGGAAGGG
jgi:hypothetical protein